MELIRRKKRLRRPVRRLPSGSQNFGWLFISFISPIRRQGAVLSCRGVSGDATARILVLMHESKK
jgi:hypothetical protein